MEVEEGIRRNVAADGVAGQGRAQELRTGAEGGRIPVVVEQGVVERQRLYLTTTVNGKRRIGRGGEGMDGEVVVERGGGETVNRAVNRSVSQSVEMMFDHT